MRAFPFFQKRYQYIASAVIFIAVFFIGFYHSAHGGINLTDEGLYIAAPLHYKFGVVPFRDAIHNATRQYDLLMAPVFWIFPQINLLQFRLLGVILHLSGLIALFFLFSRFAPPILVATVCAILFLVNNFLGTPSPSYNLLVSAFGSWSFALWMYSLFSSGRKSIFLSIGAGIAMSFAIISNISAGVVILVPFVFALLFWKLGKYHYAISTVVVLIAVASIFFICSMTLALSGILPYYLDALRNDAFSSNVSVGGLGSKMTRSLRELLFMAPQALYMIGVFGVSMLFIKFRPKQISIYWWLGVGSITIAILLLLTTRVTWYYMTIVIMSLFLTPLTIFTIQKKHGIEKIVFAGALAWGLVQVVSYGSFSTNGLESAVKGALASVVVSIVSLYELYGGIVVQHNGKKIAHWYGYVVLGLSLLVFVLYGIRFYVLTNYLDFTPEKLTAVFHHSKLAGIYSVPEKIKPLEELLAYLKPRVKPGDYFLAYNDLPLLYFLTDTQPVYPNVWTFEYWWPLPYRQNLLAHMIDSGHKANYAVHMVTNPGYGWVTPVAEGQSFDNHTGSCIVCEYVEKNYVLEKMIFPFEIWRRDDNTNKLPLLDEFSLYYTERLASWKEATIDDGKTLVQKPFEIEATHGNYTITTRKDGNDTIVRFTVTGSPVNMAFMDVSYFTKRADLPFASAPGQEVAITATMRLSERRSTFPFYNGILYVQDRVDTPQTLPFTLNAENTKGYPAMVNKDSLYWRTNSVSLFQTQWHTYVVTRKLRDKSTHITYGFTWVPSDIGDFIEIKDIRLYTSNTQK